MRRWLPAAALAAFVLASTAPGASAAQRARDRLDVYTAVVQADQLRALADQGFELSDVRAVAGGDRGPARAVQGPARRADA